MWNGLMVKVVRIAVFSVALTAACDRTAIDGGGEDSAVVYVHIEPVSANENAAEVLGTRDQLMAGLKERISALNRVILVPHPLPEEEVFRGEQLVVSSSMTQQAGQLRLQISIREILSGTVLWSAIYDEQVRDGAALLERAIGEAVRNVETRTNQ